MARVRGKNPAVDFFGLRQIPCILELQRLVKKRLDIIGSRAAVVWTSFFFLRAVNAPHFAVSVLHVFGEGLLVHKGAVRDFFAQIMPQCFQPRAVGCEIHRDFNVFLAALRDQFLAALRW
jgi:hypothetical protein